ncbi:MAG: cytochrome c oxidase subunit II [Burkholderiales bacterium]
MMYRVPPYLISCLTFLWSAAARADLDLNLKTPVTPVAREIYDLHTIILLICLAIFVIVFGIMFYSIFKHRKSKGYEARQFHENTGVEIFWTIIPFFILVGMAIPATTTILNMKDAKAGADMTIKVTGYQWKWGYDYLDEGISFFSTLSTPREQIEGKASKGENYLLEVDNPMVVPTGKKVRVLLTANDVIHAWWVPAFGVKQDAIPGFVRDAWFKVDQPGTYRGQCAELCGKDHGYMPIVVEVMEPEKYTQWVAARKEKTKATAADSGKKFTMEEAMAQGEKVYTSTCAVCHQANGQGVPPAFPALAGGKVATGDKAEHINTVLNGKNLMPPFGKQLSPAEIAAVVTYERNSFGNKTGDLVQASDVTGGAAAAAPAAETPPAAPPAEAAPVTAAPAAPQSDSMPATIFFEVGKSTMPADAKDAIAGAVEYLKAQAGAKVEITGYTDKTGNADKNIELAKERAKAVREALKAAGVSEDRMIMKPPASITGSGSDREARRVEINTAL